MPSALLLLFLLTPPRRRRRRVVVESALTANARTTKVGHGAVVRTLHELGEPLLRLLPYAFARATCIVVVAGDSESQPAWGYVRFTTGPD